MSVQVLCPSCGEVTAFHRLPVTDCPKCHRLLPDKLRVATTRALAADQAPKPALLLLGQIFSLFAAGIILLLLISAPFDVGSYSINGQPVSGPEFLRRAGWLFGVVAVVLGAIGIGLLIERPWSRQLMLAYWLLIPLALLLDDDVTAEELFAMSFFTALGAGIAWWYLYRKTNVRAYFEARHGAS